MGWLPRKNISGIGMPDKTYFKSDISFDIEFKSSLRGRKGLSIAQETVAKTTLKTYKRDTFIISSIEDFQRVLLYFEELSNLHMLHSLQSLDRTHLQSFFVVNSCLDD